MINVTREDLIKKLSEESGYFQKDLREVLKSLDKVVLNCFAEVDDEDEVEVQLVEGVKLLCKVVPERERVDPRNYEPITVKATVKPGVRYSQLFREKIQNNYENKKG